MIHPNTELCFIDASIGYGVKATAFMPTGTIVFVQDQLDLELTPERFEALDDLHRDLAEKYSYKTAEGHYVLSWDHAKYVNHSCDCNTMSTGYGFEIAIRDIEPGDEITDEYGLFNVDYELTLSCGCKNCRRTLRPNDVDEFYPLWDRLTEDAVQRIPTVDQPLWSIVDPETRSRVMDFLDGGPFESVLSLKYNRRDRRLSGNARPLTIECGSPVAPLK